MLYNKDSWIGKYFGYLIENPLKTWWKAREYFKFPKVKFSIGGIELCPIGWVENISRILDIHICDVGWKSKFNSPRFESCPQICITLFRKYCFSIFLHVSYIDLEGRLCDVDLEYWEYLLDYLYFHKKLTIPALWRYKSEIFTDDDNPINIYIPTIPISLNKKGLQQFRRMYAKSRF